MIFEFISSSYSTYITLSGIIFSVILSFFLLSLAPKILPADHGRAFSVDGSQSKGKPTGAGLLFIPAFCLSSLLFVPFRLEFLIYYIVFLFEMMVGFLDDRAPVPWSEYKKGLLDAVISVATAYTFVLFHSTEVFLPILGISFTIPAPLFIILASILVWASINVTNITDGVDGLSSSLVIISILFILLYTFFVTKADSIWNYSYPLLVGVLFPYLWFNRYPSRLLMGDGGSRPLGVFLAISVLFSKNPFCYLIFCLIIILDGGASIFKLSVMRFLKISVLKNIRTPLHDHMRKNKDWSIPQVTIRYNILHFTICTLFFLLSYFLA